MHVLKNTMSMILKHQKERKMHSIRHLKHRANNSEPENRKVNKGKSPGIVEISGEKLAEREGFEPYFPEQNPYKRGGLRLAVFE